MSSAAGSAGENGQGTPRSTPEGLSSNAVTRTLSDMHAPTWLALLALNITARTLVFHPMQLAVARKRVTREDVPPSTWSLIRASYKGGDVRFPAASKGSVTTSMYTLGRGGIRGMYRGVGAALVSNLGGEISYLFTLELLRERLNARSAGQGNVSQDGSVACNGLSGTGGGGETVGESEAMSFRTSSTSAAVGAMCGDLVALALVTPMVLVASRQMTAGYGMASQSSYTNVWQTFKTVWRTYPVEAPRATTFARCVQGARGIYQGASAGLLRIPSSGCWWALYTKNKELLYTAAAPWLLAWEEEANAARQEVDANGQPLPSARAHRRHNWFLSATDNPLLNALAGIVASVCTTVLFNPIAVIQTRQQAIPKVTQTPAADASGASVRAWRLRNPFGDVVRISRDLVKREGVRAFFKGTSANVSVAVLDGIIFSLLFELTKLGSDNEFLVQLSNG